MSFIAGTMWVVRHKMTLWIDPDLAENFNSTYSDLLPGTLLLVLDTDSEGEPIVLDSRTGAKGRISPGRFIHETSSGQYGALQRIS
jgi:hypothetical protein